MCAHSRPVERPHTAHRVGRLRSSLLACPGRLTGWRIFGRAAVFAASDDAVATYRSALRRLPAPSLPYTQTPLYTHTGWRPLSSLRRRRRPISPHPSAPDPQCTPRRTAHTLSKRPLSPPPPPWAPPTAAAPACWGRRRRRSGGACSVCAGRVSARGRTTGTHKMGRARFVFFPFTHQDRRADALQLGLVVVELLLLGQVVGLQPVDGGVHSLLDRLLVSRRQLGRNLLVAQRVAHGVGVRLEVVARLAGRGVGGGRVGR